MRAFVLIAGLLLAGGAAAAPASPADVGRIMQTLGMNGLGEQAGSTLVGNVPQLKALDAKGQACAAGQASALMDRQFQQIVVNDLGADGQVLIGQWNTFLASPAGQDMARTFRASAAAALNDGAGADDVVLSDASKAQIATFMGTPAFTKFIGVFGGESKLPEDIGQQLADVLKRECQIALDLEQIS